MSFLLVLLLLSLHARVCLCIVHISQTPKAYNEIVNSRPFIRNIAWTQWNTGNVELSRMSVGVNSTQTKTHVQINIWNGIYSMVNFIWWFFFLLLGDKLLRLRHTMPHIEKIGKLCKSFMSAVHYANEKLVHSKFLEHIFFSTFTFTTRAAYFCECASTLIIPFH